MVADLAEVWARFLAGGLPVDGVPYAVRALVGLVGLAVLLGGGRFGRHGLRLAVAACGALLGAAFVGLAFEVPAPGAARTITGLLLAAAGALLWIEALSWRVALIVVGFVAGAWLGQDLAEVGGASLPAAVPLGLGLAFAVAAPWVYEPATRFVSPLLAAPAVAWAVGSVGGIVLLVALWGAGVTVQLFTGPAFVDMRPIPSPADWRRPR